MARQELRDRNRHLLGYLGVLGDGRHELRDPDNRLLGRFDPTSNETRDENNHLIGTGDLLPTLL